MPPRRTHILPYVTRGKAFSLPPRTEGTMKFFSTLHLAAAISGMLVCAGPAAHSATGCPGGCAVFDHSVQAFQVSGPVSLNVGQTASVCATNLDSSPAFILIGLLQPDNGSLLATSQAQPA